MGNAASKCRAVHPLPDEAIWWKISRHLTLAQWARVAGTCKASWGLQLHPQVHIKGDLPVAGMLCLRAFSETVCISTVPFYGRLLSSCCSVSCGVYMTAAATGSRYIRVCCEQVTFSCSTDARLHQSYLLRWRVSRQETRSKERWGGTQEHLRM